MGSPTQRARAGVHAVAKARSKETGIDVAAEALRAGAPAFTRRNLYFAVRRAGGAATTEARFEAALRRRLASGPVPGLLPERRSHRLPSGWDAEPPKAVLLVDRPAILGLFMALAHPAFTAACIDGTPPAVVARLARRFREGLRVPVLYLHDAATVVYPFAIEPLATLVEVTNGAQQGEPIVYRDLGLPPLGAAADRFGDASLPNGEEIVELEAIPPATLLRYVVKAVSA
jgi:hypothetical protein